MEAEKVTRFSENSKPPWALIALTPHHSHLGQALTSEAWLAPLETGTSWPPAPALTRNPAFLIIRSRSPWKPSIFSGPTAQQTPSTAVSSVLSTAHSLACSAAGKSVPASGVQPRPPPTEHAEGGWNRASQDLLCPRRCPGLGDEGWACNADFSRLI